MRLDIAHHCACQRRHPLQGTHLRRHHPRNLGRGHRDHPPPESFAIRIAGMRADAYPPLGRPAQRGEHHLGVARMPATGQIGAGHQIQHRRLIPDGPGAVALAQIGIQIDRPHGHSPAPCAAKACARMALRLWRGVSASGEMFRSSTAPVPDASARPKAAAKSSVRSTRSA